jgi:hypothetical protein
LISAGDKISGTVLGAAWNIYDWENQAERGKIRNAITSDMKDIHKN